MLADEGTAKQHLRHQTESHPTERGHEPAEENPAQLTLCLSIAMDTLAAERSHDGGRKVNGGDQKLHGKQTSDQIECSGHTWQEDGQVAALQEERRDVDQPVRLYARRFASSTASG